MGQRKLVFVGNGLVGMRTIEEILQLDRTKFQIKVFSREQQPCYNRILLSEILQGKASFEGITLHDENWYQQQQIELHTGETVISIDPIQKQLLTDKGHLESYDELILATGSTPFVPIVPGIEKEGVVTLRTIEDAKQILNLAMTSDQAVVIGGGVLGLEVARGLLERGLGVTVVHLGKYLMDRQLDETAARWLQRDLEKQGLKFMFAKETAAIEGDHRVNRIVFTDGSSLKAELVLIAAGVRPNLQLAKAARIETNRAIVVNDYLQTNVPHIYAVGECCEHRGRVHGLVAPLYEQAKILARHLCGEDAEAKQDPLFVTKVKLPGIQLLSVGDIQDTADTQTVMLEDGIHGTYEKLLTRNYKLVGAIFYGKKIDSLLVQDLIQKKKTIDFDERSLLPMFQSQSVVETISLTSTICQCHSVTKETILTSMSKYNCQNLKEVKECTSASSACGGCKGLVEQLISYSHRQNATHQDQSSASQPFCSCTQLTEEEVVEAIIQQSLTDLAEVRRKLYWQHQQGCLKCQTAIPYYLGLIFRKNRWPRVNGVSIISDQELICGCLPERGLAAKLRVELSELSTPAQVRLAIVSCEHNSIDALTREFGAIRMRRGWELYGGGSSGRDRKFAELICVAETEEQAADYFVSLLQYYRETARFAEQPREWLKRLGLISIREVIFTDDTRSELLERAKKGRVPVKRGG